MITGKDKGKQGQVVRVLGDKVIVEGVNVVKRHQNPTRAALKVKHHCKKNAIGNF